jgi:hypothetical protein
MTVAVVFFSKYCPHSEKFLSALKSSGQDSSISKFICVDKQGNGQRPREVKACNITEVPTVICDAKLLPGIKAFKWLIDRIKSQETTVEGQSYQGKTVKAVSGVETSGRFNGGGKFSGILEDTRIAGDSDYLGEGDIQKQETLVLLDDNISGAIKKMSQDEDDYTSVGKRDALKAKQLTNAYNQLLIDRKS